MCTMIVIIAKVCHHFITNCHVMSRPVHKMLRFLPIMLCSDSFKMPLLCPVTPPLCSLYAHHAHFLPIFFGLSYVESRSLSISDTTSLLPASLLPPSSPAELSFAACRDPATLEPSAILDRAAAHALCTARLDLDLSCMHERRALRAAPH